MIVYYTVEITETKAIILDDEHIHCSKVLRNKKGDLIYLTDGFGSLYKGIIDEVSKSKTIVGELEEVEKSQVGHKRQIAIAPTKNIDRLEWFLEKSTEIGITDIFPFVSNRSERKIIKPKRLNKIILSAMKQSKNLHKPILHNLDKFSSLVSRTDLPSNKFFAHCMEPESSLQKLYESRSDAVVLIGPEGDFTGSELKLALENNWKEVSLGASRYRTETAGIIACHLLNL